MNNPIPFNLRIFLCSLLFPMALAVSGQIPIKTYTSATDTFYWKRYIHIAAPSKLSLNRIAMSGQRKTIDRFLSENPDQFPQFTNDSISRYTVKDLRKNLYTCDINDDNLPDIIFSGFSGGESDITRIWLNRGGSFELIFEDYQYISKFVRVKGMLTELQTGDVGCCDNYLYFTRDYRFTMEDGRPVFVKGKQTVACKYTEEPARVFENPKFFIAAADTIMLRASAAVLNEPFNPYLETFGNIVAKYRSKVRGNVLAAKTDTKGKLWYFVEIFPDTQPSASILYQTETMPTFVRGWVSGESIILQQ